MSETEVILKKSQPKRAGSSKICQKCGTPDNFEAKFCSSCCTPFPQIAAQNPLPPPTPSSMATCPYCKSPIRYIQQYQRWYCDKEKRYV